MTEKVFVYGTLKGEGLSDKIGVPQNLVKPVPAVLPGAAMYFAPDHVSFPAVFLTGSKDDMVVGELIEIDEELLRMLDSYEGVSRDPKYSLYFRVEVEALTNKPEKCWVYVGNPDKSTISDILRHGDIIEEF